MSQTNFAGLIKDPEINLKMQLCLRAGAANQYHGLKNRYGYENSDYWSPFFVRMNGELAEIEKVSEGEKQNLLNNFYGTLKETYELLGDPITPEVEEKLRKDFDDIFNSDDISEVGISSRNIEDQISALLDNDYIRGGTITFLKPKQPIENEDLRQIQEGLFNRYKEHFDLQDSSSMSHVKIPFAPQNLETEYINVINMRNKINEIYNNTNNNLSENDKKYCEQALKDISSFIIYLTNQMVTIVSLEPQATIEEVGNLQEKLWEILRSDLYNTSKVERFSNLLFSLDKTSVERAQKFLNEAKNPKDAAQKIYDALLASEKEVELNCRSLVPGESKRGDIDQVPFNINSRFRDLIDMYSQIADLGIPLRENVDGEVDSRNITAINNESVYNLPVVRLNNPEKFQECKKYNDFVISVKSEQRVLESKINEIGRAILPGTKAKKMELQRQLNLLNGIKETKQVEKAKSKMKNESKNGKRKQKTK